MTMINRRRFLEDSLFAVAAAGAAVAGMECGQPLFAQEKGTSANEKLGVAVIGIGGRGGSHVSSFANDSRTTILYLCDPDEKINSASRMDGVTEKQAGIAPKFITDMRKAFDDPAVDIISCATPNHWHTLCGIWAMQAGKSCYLEKPISHNLHEGYAIEAASKKYRKVVQTGSQCRSNKALIDAVKFIRDGGIGEVKFARGLCYKPRPSIGAKDEYEIPKGVDYDLWSGPAQIAPLTRPKFHYDWHWQREYGNGDLGNQGPHQTDIACWFLDVDRYPKSILSYGGRLGYQAERKDDNYVDAGDTANTEVSIYDYGDRCMVFETRGLKTPSLSCPNGKVKEASASIGVIACGTKGYLVQSTYSYCAAFDLEGNMIKEFKGGGNHFDNFIRAVQNDDPSFANATARIGALSAAVSHMGNISYYLGENNRVSVDELSSALGKIKSLDDNDATLKRTVEHLESNGVDLEKYPISLGPNLAFDPEKLEFADLAARQLASREYRDGFVVPKASEV